MLYPYLEIVIGVALVTALIVGLYPHAQPFANLVL